MIINKFDYNVFKMLTFFKFSSKCINEVLDIQFKFFNEKTEQYNKQPS